MSDDAHKVPAVTKTAFNCPHCDVYAQQWWFSLLATHPGAGQWTPYEEKSSTSKESQLFEMNPGKSILANDVLDGKAVLGDQSTNATDTLYSIYNVWVSRCSHCRELAVWVNEKMAYPSATLGIRPNQDLPDDIKGLFEEARAVASASPRSAAALLRSCIERLFKHLGVYKGNLYDSIAGLVKEEGLDPELKEMLHTVRVIGNSAIHPGKLNEDDNDDNKERVLLLFGIVNFIAERMISLGKSLTRLQDGLPEEDRKRIDQTKQGRRRE